MKVSRICSFLLLLFFSSAFPKGQELQLKITNSKTDLPENFCTLGEKGAKAEINTEYRIHANWGKIDLTSRIKDTGKIPINDLQYSLYFNALHQYSFSPFHHIEHPDLNFRVYQKKGHYLGWLTQNPIRENEEPLPGMLRPGESFEVRYILLVNTKGDDLLTDLLWISRSMENTSREIS